MIDKVYGLLEKYIEGKDLDRYKILEEIYSPTAIVSFIINADNVEFPNEIHGNLEIVKILSADFNKKYDLVKTYYLSKHFHEIDSLQIKNQNWLVVMKERSSGNIRVGTGYYNWDFEKLNTSELKIRNHKIFIHSMLELPSESIDLLYDLQKTFRYPWANKENVVQVLQQYEELTTVSNYLK